MTPSRQSEESLFEAALELPREQRETYLNQACAGDAALRARIEALLAGHEQTDGILDKANEAALQTPRPRPIPPAENPGDKIGPYKLLQQIGEGGCGVVWMAEQESPVRRRVALKIIKLGMDTKLVVARFEAERQALALMDHPNIAKVFDAGATETGRPFFVMELVRGIRITDFCEQNHFSTGQRLALFTQVCQAVQHAHQKGIIHRDLKPSNILVADHDGVPVPKVIDFGIAKATTGERLTDKTVFTAFEQFLGTPAYMSPEQANLSGLDIDTRTDIYSLGVLLYELLTEKTPFDAKELLRAGLDEMRRTIREVEPVKPSTRLTQELAAADVRQFKSPRSTGEKVGADARRLLQEVRGDLDWIVMKCLEKDRSRRYETANGLARDVQRFLNHEPIAARPPSNLYRFQKLVHRNKLALAAACAVTGALIGGAGLSTWMYFQERQARSRAAAAEQSALTEAAKSRQVAVFLKDMLNGVGPSVALGRDRTMLREILDRTAARVGEDLSDQPAVQVELRLVLADIYHSLTLYPEMEAMGREGLRVARETFGDEHATVADALWLVGDALMHRRVLAEAEAFTRDSLAMQTKLRGRESAEVAHALYTLTSILRFQWAERVPDAAARLREAEAACREALATRRSLLGNEHPDVAKSLDALSSVLRSEGKLGESETVARESLALREKIFPGEHPDLTRSLQVLGEILAEQGRLDEAENYLRAGLEMGKRMHGGDGLAIAHDGLARVLQRKGDLPGAEMLFRQAIEIGKKHLGRDHPEVATYLVKLAGILREEGKFEEAARVEQEALATRRKRVGFGTNAVGPPVSLVNSNRAAR